VLLPEYGGQKIELNDEEYHLFREDDILGIMD
jgi:chaperonin GroES